MIGLLLVTHGKLGDELVKAARRIVRSPIPMEAISIAWDDDVQEVSQRIEQMLEVLEGGQGIVIATDMLGGTPANVAMAFLDPGRVEVVTGVNLPMVIKLNNLLGQKTVAEAAKIAAAKGRSHITVAGEILSGQRDN